MTSSLSNLVLSLAEIKSNVKIVLVPLNMKMLRMIVYNINVYFAIKIIITGLMKNLKINLRTHLKGHSQISKTIEKVVSKSISHVIKYTNFQLHSVHPDGVISKT